MTSGNVNTAETIAGLLQERLTHLAGRGNLLNEAATLDLVIKPTLEALGYPPDYRIPEHGEQRNRLDESCYLGPITDRPGYAAIIVEAKQLDVDFDRHTPGQGRADSPNRQIQRYLERHKASGPNTLGVLTDGARWRIYRRAGAPETPETELITDFDFRELTGRQGTLAALTPSLRENLERLVDLLSWESINFRTTRSLIAVKPTRWADELFSAMAGDVFRPDDLLQKLVNDPAVVGQSDLTAAVNLQGKALDAHTKDWQNYAYVAALPWQTDNPALLEQKVVVAAVRFAHQEGAGLSRADVALAARAFAGADQSKAAVLLAYTAAADGGREARLAVAAAGQVNMTAAFDPTLAAPSARAAAEQLLQLLHRPPAAGLSAEQLLLPLEAATLRQQFYREIAGWTTHWQAGQGRPQRQAILRHLVRLMFAWILKEENSIEETLIPAELFEQAWAQAALPAADQYHREILRFLFHERLNVPVEQRGDHSNGLINSAMARARFLNGSLFAKHNDDDTLDLPDAAYWHTDAARPGLFTLLSRYHWTMDEHRPGESEQTLDPELLSNLFERLITPTEEGSAVPLRQPQGTYYTPADVADEMVQDALAAAVRDYAPARVTDAQLREMFGSADAALPPLNAAQKGKLRDRIKELRIFDPAVGSGEFLLSVLTALRRALTKLEPAAANPVAAIIRRQLAGQDINPLAVQITRLRLFIALTAARRNEPAPEPLPNLEARIVCADTLATVANPEWRPERPGRLTDAFPELTAALTALAANRAEWFDAHTEAAKQQVLTAERRGRDRLESLLQSRADLASPELLGLAQSSLYNIHPTAAATDARLLFYENPWRGFDVVIGNPPYEALSKSMDRAAVNALREGKGYQTTNVADLYSLFCETALALANPEGGVVTLIVPHSISFGQQQRGLRALFEQHCRSIKLRHQGNRPDSTFRASPTVQHQENRQQTTIIVGELSRTSGTSITTTGWQRWPAAERVEFLRSRNEQPIPIISGDATDARISHQWPRVPTDGVRKLIEAIHQQQVRIGDYEVADGVHTLALPKVAYLFMPTTPWSGAATKDQSPFKVKSYDDLRLLMAALNGHVAYAWWQAFGDNFHVLKRHLTAITIPDAWVENPEPAIAIGERLIEAIPECTRVTNRMFGVQTDADFYLKPGLIAELDWLHLGALGYEGAAGERLLGQLRKMRSSSSWDYGG